MCSISWARVRGEWGECARSVAVAKEASLMARLPGREGEVGGTLSIVGCYNGG